VSEIPRRSPKLSPAYSKDEVRDAVETLEDRPRIPEGTPASMSALGFAGQILVDDNYIYIKTRGGNWKRAALSTF
jgi:hypothetical protein